MKKNKIAALSAATAVFMLAATACSAPTKEAATEAPTIQETTTTVPETTTAGTTAETTTVPETTVPSKAGTADAAGKFTAASGAYELTAPKGWSLEPNSDEQYTTYISENGNDSIEIIYKTSNIENVADELPATAEEYKEQYTRGEEGLELITYNVVNNKNGKGQTFDYSLRYTAANAETKYTRISGYYNLEADKFLSVIAMINSPGEEVITAANAAMDSLKLN